MNPRQQHEIRNGIICIRRIARWLLEHSSLTSIQRRYIEEMQEQAERVETACSGCQQSATDGEAVIA